MNFLKPHTKKWFAAVARFNPWQAALTMALLQTAKSDDVCSFCARTPAGIYRLVKGTLEEKTPGTFRVCNECVEVRERSFGERFVSLTASPVLPASAYLTPRPVLAAL